MRVSTTEDYSLRCLSRLARAAGRRLTIGAIAEAEGLTEENTAKVLARLRDAGLVRSYRGKDGGYVLARPASAISLGEVLGDIGGRMFELERCQGTNGGDGCVHHGDCGILPVWMTLGRVVHTFLSSITMEDLVRPEDQVRRRLRGIVASLELSGASADAQSGEGDPRPLEPFVGSRFADTAETGDGRERRSQVTTTGSS